MANILAVGIATLDIINTVDRYPDEDSEVRATKQTKTRGGNATNTLTVLSQLGHQCYWAGVLIDETDNQAIIQNLKLHQIDISACKRLSSGKMPTSYITQNKHTGSRTIVHYRHCPEYDFTSFEKIDLTPFDWVHFEGRNVTETKKMLLYLKQNHPRLRCSLEIEKSRADIESLFSLPDWLLFSKDYALSQHQPNATSFLNSLTRHHPVQATCTWGESGAWLRDESQGIIHQATHNHLNIIDTLGAGDTFNAGFIHSQTQGKTHAKSLYYATQLASHKCTQSGLDDITHELTIDQRL